MDNVKRQKLLNEPLAPYIADTYNTLFSVVQGVAFAGLFFIISDGKNDLTLPFIIKVIVVLILIALLWHRYAVQNQFAVWSLGVQDTLIPISFAAAQCALSLSLESYTYYFSMWLAIISFIGVLAYINAVWRYNKEESLVLFLEHFDHEGREFSEAMHMEQINFSKLQLKLLVGSTIINSFLTVINYYCDWSEYAKSILTSLVAFAIIIPSLFCDLRWYLNHSRVPLLKKYKY